MNAPGRNQRRAGFTITELVVGMAISTVALAAVALASVALQRSFEAANYQITAQNDQLRVLDTLSRDLHSASAVTISNDDEELSLTLPSNDPALINLNLGPLLGSAAGGSSPTLATQTVHYYVVGGQLIRDAAGAQTSLADTVAVVHFQNQGMFVTTSLTFTPRFSSSPTAATQALTRACSTVYLRNAALTN